MRVQFENFTSVQGTLRRILNHGYAVVRWDGTLVDSVVTRASLIELYGCQGCGNDEVKCEKCYILARRQKQICLINNGRRFRYTVPASELPRVPLRASSKNGMRVSYFRG